MKSFKWFSIGKSSGSLEYDPVACTPEYQGKKGGERGAGPLSLQELTARAVVATRRNFYSIRPLAPRLKEYLTQIVKNIEVTTKFLIYWEKSDILNFFLLLVDRRFYYSSVVPHKGKLMAKIPYHTVLSF